MDTRNIIVIGASAGGFEVLKKLASAFPIDLRASIFIVWPISPEVTGFLPKVLSRFGKLPAANAVDGEAIEPVRIQALCYVAPPDFHLLIEPGRILNIRQAIVTHENLSPDSLSEQAEENSSAAKL